MHAELFDFARSTALNADSLRAFTLLNEIFARNLSDNVGVWLRSGFQVTAGSMEQLSYADFLKQLSEPCYVAALLLEPADAPMAVKMDISLVPSLVDLLLGGPGEAGEPQSLTDVEESILRSVMENICRDLSVAWAQLGVEVAFDRRQMAAQMTRLMPANERTLHVSFDVRMQFACGRLSFALPVRQANAMLLRFHTEDERSGRSSAESRARLENLLSQVVMGASLELPPVRLSARTIANLHHGDVLPLPLAVRTPARLTVAGETIFAARPARLGEHRAAQLDQKAALA